MKLKLTIPIVAVMLVLDTTSMYAQKREERPFNERPSIRISSLKILPVKPKPSDTVTIEVFISNEAFASSGSFQFLMIAGGGIVGKTNLNLKPNEKTRLVYKWQAVKPGEYLIKAIADPDGVLDENDKNDNIRELRINVSATAVDSSNNQGSEPRANLPATTDLVIKDVSVQGHIYQENKDRIVTVNFRVENNSSQDENNSFLTRITIAPESGNKKDFIIKTEKLAAGQSVYISQTIEKAPPQFTIAITADSDNAIKEADEENNRVENFYKNPAPPVNRWVSAGPSFISGVDNVGYPWPFATGRLSAIAIHPSSTDIMYVGGQSCGIWKTNNAGQSWFPITDQISVSVAAITLSPQNPNRLYWVTAHEGVYRSDDAGASWIQLASQDLDAIVHGGKVLVHPQDPNIIFVKSNDGLYRSADGGINWMLVKASAQATGVEIENTNSNNVYVAMTHDSNNDLAGIFRSFDRGISWVKMEGCPGGRLPATVSGIKITLAQTRNRLFAGFRSSDDFQIYRTTEFGCSVGGQQDRSWEKGWRTTTDHKEIWSELWANPLDENRLYLGGTAFWRSTDKGSNFEKVSDYGTPQGSAHADHHGFSVKLGQKDIIFSLNDGGIYQSASNGNKGSWSFIGKGLHNVEFYDFADAFGNGTFLMGGTQDNGTIKTTGSLEWKAVRGGDGATVDIDDINPDIVYSMGQYASSIQRSTNAGGSWSNMFAGLPTGSTCFNLRYHLHSKKMNILLAACTQLWRITDPGGSWQAIFNPPEGAVACSAIEPSSDIYLAGTTRGKIFAGIAGNNFQEIFSHPSLSGIRDIECDPENASRLFLAYAGSSTGRIFMLRKTGSGLSFSATDITGNLPANINVQCIVVDRMNRSTIYAGSSKGVYRGRSFDNGQTWQWSPYNDGMPFANVQDLEVHPVTGVLRAGTFGRGIFEVSTDHPLGSVLALEGKITFLRVHDVGTKFGPPNDVLDAEVIVRLATNADLYLGFQLRIDTKEDANVSMLELLRTAFESDINVRIEYIRNGIHSGKIFRVIL